MSRPLIKICGNTTTEDALWAVEHGADYIGSIVEHPPSPRHVSVDQALQIRRSVGESAGFVAVVVNLSLDQLRRLHDELQPDVLQLHGDETPELVSVLCAEGRRIWPAVHNAERAVQMRDVGVEAILVDARATSAEGTIYGGTGQRSDWVLAKSLVGQGEKVVLAGGLDAGNVAGAIAQVQPWAVDVLSGVEIRKGVKDPEKVARFMAVARGQ